MIGLLGTINLWLEFNELEVSMMPQGEGGYAIRFEVNEQLYMQHHTTFSP